MKPNRFDMFPSPLLLNEVGVPTWISQIPRSQFHPGDPG